ncbi:hypothetical protein [Ammoniphilus sp. CFH 90114]|uniref:hypothetical protein n=1 Tax=Ammoniphilus sp. CFH 90114 TaxID=2493665 RepID=UPI00100ED8B6|nr:hypothetical protein [Ammoniphilus sp. CFH 90114]RXT07280.1 hypothetical protein EIZ39_14185 [Ammoniphilus sp. CFH 90114]
MEKTSLTIELDVELLKRVEEIAEEAGVSTAEWCAYAITQQFTMQESMEDLLVQVENLGLNVEKLDFETITQQLFSSVIDLDPLVEVINENDDAPKIILPNSATKKDTNKD